MTTAKRERAIGFVCVIASALAFGVMAILARIAYDAGTDIPTLLALRFGLAAIAMGAFLGATRARLPARDDLGRLVALGTIGYAGQAFTFFSALLFAPAGIVALLLYTHPAMVALLAAWRLHETLTRARLVALAIALAGTALTIVPSLTAASASVATQPLGVALGLAAAIIYSVYIVAGAGVTRRVAATTMATVIIASAACVFTLIAIARGPQWPATAAGWLAVIGIALVSTVAAITLFFAGVTRIGPTRAATLSTVEPACTVLLAALVLGERVAPIQLAGGILILAAVVLLARAAQPAPTAITEAA
jgi:drug/metabolite transporter (DMT)-like permease